MRGERRILAPQAPGRCGVGRRCLTSRYDLQVACTLDLSFISKVSRVM